MKIQMSWVNSMKFQATSDGNGVLMDAKSPIGQGAAMTPKELVAAGLGGCSAMDVAALFKKHKQIPKEFNIEVDVQTSTGRHPAVFTRAEITYIATGDISESVFIEAVTASQTKYCGVSAMLVRSFPIHYKIILNGKEIGKGQAQFE